MIQTETEDRIRVAVAGACGRMGKLVVQTVLKQPDMVLVGAVDKQHVGEDIGTIAVEHPIGITVTDYLGESLTQTRPHVLVDFTTLGAAVSHIYTALEHGVIPVVGTSGFSAQTLSDIREAVERTGTACIIVPNFAIGAVLMMQFAREAARYFPNVEIIEMHHDGKIDSPSGTAIRTAEVIAAARTERPRQIVQEQKFEGARGASVASVPVHSVRLPGLVAHQMVIFGGQGELLTIRHDSMDRQSFMPGVMLAIRKAQQVQGLVVGLEHLL
ncbi:MAG: 4-hydroxy-tetrahydrodipicolinate reductase [Armatimonadota bacterium]|nr:MAG: 4-hydroxy-tetrahydrodipicolinate reductase [Armatimonadota bacterium]